MHTRNSHDTDTIMKQLSTYFQKYGYVGKETSVLCKPLWSGLCTLWPLTTLIDIIGHLNIVQTCLYLLPVWGTVSDIWWVVSRALPDTISRLSHIYKAAGDTWEDSGHFQCLFFTYFFPCCQISHLTNRAYYSRWLNSSRWSENFLTFLCEATAFLWAYAGVLMDDEMLHHALGFPQISKVYVNKSSLCPC